MVMPRAFYRQAVGDGRITTADLSAAVASNPAAELSVERLLAALDAPPSQAGRPARVATVADVLDSLAEGDRQVSRTAFMVDEISKFCAAYFDEGQAVWPAPWREMTLFEAWRWYMRFDGNARAMGVKGMAGTIAALPAEPEQAIAILRDLRAQGVELSIDDFGTGYSSMAYLKRLPVGTLKLDRHFVIDVADDPRDADLCAGVIALAHKLGLKVVAEGVETDDQRQALLARDCDLFQGYLFSKPLPAAQVAGYLQALPKLAAPG